uniref:UBX domain protein 11 n=1 Tax=Nothobranchius rachovii TaxID=451742 RepID=A0A1A8QN59_9TELE
MLHKTASGAKLAKKDPVPLKLYRNGIEMFDGPFKAPSAACRTSWVTASLLSSSRDFQMVSLLRRSHLLPTILVFHPGSQEEADHRSEKAAKDGGQSWCGDRHQEFSEGDCRFHLILGAQRLLWTHLVARGQTLSCKRTSPKAVITLKVKSEDEDQTFMVKM